LTAATEKALPKGSGEGLVRWYRPLAVGLTAFALAVGAFVVWTFLTDPKFAEMWGFDRTTYADATRRWLATGSFYNPWQLGGPYPLHYRDILYPPIALLVLVPAMALPPLLWWLIPLAIYGSVIAYHRPAWWAWPLIAWCVCWPVSLLVIGNGNPGIWAAAAVALGTLAGWPAVMVLIKPTLAPFALIGARRRSWWLALGVLALLALPFGGLWLDWLHAVTDAHNDRMGLLYSLGEVPWLAAPIIAWRARQTRP
jgi:hypothetical protein